MKHFFRISTARCALLAVSLSVTAPAFSWGSNPSLRLAAGGEQAALPPTHRKRDFRPIRPALIAPKAAVPARATVPPTRSDARAVRSPVAPSGEVLALANRPPVPPHTYPPPNLDRGIQEPPLPAFEPGPPIEYDIVPETTAPVAAGVPIPAEKPVAAETLPPADEEHAPASPPKIPSPEILIESTDDDEPETSPKPKVSRPSTASYQRKSSSRSSRSRSWGSSRSRSGPNCSSGR